MLSRRPATVATTCRCTRSVAKACSSRRCSARCSTAAPTSPCTRPRTCPRPRPKGSAIAAFTERRDPRDVLVGATLADLPQGATVATGSVRRRAQLARSGPTSTSSSCAATSTPGSTKIPDGGAIVMAAAALQILGLTDRIAEHLSIDEFVPAVGQGCVAVETRGGRRSDRRAGRSRSITRRRAAQSKSSGRSSPNSGPGVRCPSGPTPPTACCAPSSPTPPGTLPSVTCSTSPAPTPISNSRPLRHERRTRRCNDLATRRQAGGGHP